MDRWPAITPVFLVVFQIVDSRPAQASAVRQGIRANCDVIYSTPTIVGFALKAGAENLAAWVLRQASSVTSGTARYSLAFGAAQRPVHILCRKAIARAKRTYQGAAIHLVSAIDVRYWSRVSAV
jgi:hypothetical protein